MTDNLEILETAGSCVSCLAFMCMSDVSVIRSYRDAVEDGWTESITQG